MAKIALLSTDLESRGRYLSTKVLPDSYMGDFTLMGFVVDHYRDAVKLLIAAGYTVDEQSDGAEICIDTPQQLPRIKFLLAAHTISCDLSDIADTLYQA